MNGPCLRGLGHPNSNSAYAVPLPWWFFSHSKIGREHRACPHCHHRKTLRWCMRKLPKLQALINFTLLLILECGYLSNCRVGCCGVCIRQPELWKPTGWDVGRAGISGPEDGGDPSGRLQLARVLSWFNCPSRCPAALLTSPMQLAALYLTSSTTLPPHLPSQSCQGRASSLLSSCWAPGSWEAKQCLPWSLPPGASHRPALHRHGRPLIGSDAKWGSSVCSNHL